MWPFKKKLPELTNDVYAMWLRAQRPPWEWFLRQPELVQAQLAIIGDDYTEDQAVAIGAAVRNPVAAAAGAGDEDAEEALAIMLTSAHGAQNGAQSPVEKPRPTMGGVTKRRVDRVQKAQQDRDEASSFMGQKPDAVEVPD